MINVYTVVFFGYRHIDNIIKTEKLLESYIRRLINEKEYVAFFGRTKW